MRSTTRQFAQWNLILAHFQHSKLNTLCMYRIALLTLGMLHGLCVCMVVQLYPLRAQQSKHLLSVEFSWRETADVPPRSVVRVAPGVSQIYSGCEKEWMDEMKKTWKHRFSKLVLKNVFEIKFLKKNYVGCNGGRLEFRLYFNFVCSDF